MLPATTLPLVAANSPFVSPPSFCFLRPFIFSSSLARLFVYLLHLRFRLLYLLPSLWIAGAHSWIPGILPVHSSHLLSGFLRHPLRLPRLPILFPCRLLFSSVLASVLFLLSSFRPPSFFLLPSSPLAPSVGLLSSIFVRPSSFSYVLSLFPPSAPLPFFVILLLGGGWGEIGSCAREARGICHSGSWRVGPNLFSRNTSSGPKAGGFGLWRTYSRHMKWPRGRMQMSLGPGPSVSQQVERGSRRLMLVTLSRGLAECCGPPLFPVPLVVGGVVFKLFPPFVRLPSPLSPFVAAFWPLPAVSFFPSVSCRYSCPRPSFPSRIPSFLPLFFFLAPLFFSVLPYLSAFFLVPCNEG